MSIAKAVHLMLRWTARSIGGLILSFVLLHLISEGFPKIEATAIGDGVLWGGFVISLIGFVLLWKWELVGGSMALLGIALFYIANFALSGKFPGGWVLPLFFLPGLLSIVCWIAEHTKASSLS